MAPWQQSAMHSADQIVVDVKPDALAINPAASAVVILNGRGASSIEISQFGLVP
jgi:hypothetical protein